MKKAKINKKNVKASAEASLCWSFFSCKRSRWRFKRK